MRSLIVLCCLCSFPAWAAGTAKPTGTLIDFRVEARKMVANDLGQATAYVETNGSNPGEVANRVKAVLGEALEMAKAEPAVIVRSGGTHTWPIYAKGGRTIEGWGMRAELVLESRDAGALANLVGRMQPLLAIGSLHFIPAPEMRRKAESDATLEAIAAFRTQAGRIAGVMKKPFRIRQMSISGPNQPPSPRTAARGAALMSAEAVPMPVEAGESSISVVVSGKIQLLD